MLLEVRLASRPSTGSARGPGSGDRPERPEAYGSAPVCESLILGRICR